MWMSNASNSNATSTTAISSVENASTVDTATEDATEFAPPPSRGSLDQQLTTSKPTITIKSFVSSIPSLKAEICWETKVVNSHDSYKSCEDVGDIFQAIFPDSDIAKQFTRGERKVACENMFESKVFIKS